MVASGLPLYWKKPFWMALCLSPDGICTSKIFIPFLRYLLTDVPDDAAKFVRILSSASRNFPVGYDKNNYNNNNTNMNIKYYTDHGNYCQDLKFVELTMTEFVQMIQDIIDTHPGVFVILNVSCCGNIIYKIKISMLLMYYRSWFSKRCPRVSQPIYNHCYISDIL